MNKAIKKAVLNYALDELCRKVTKLEEKGTVFINIFNTGIVLDSKQVLQYIQWLKRNNK
jgi:hypothetical protein